MRVVVPYAPDRPKTRLAPALDADERTAFARAMLEDVLAALAALDSSSDRDSSERDADASAADGDRASPDRVADALAVDPVVLSTAPVDVDVPVSVDERSLTAAVNDRLPSRPGDDPVAVVMADLALATPAALARLFVPDADVVLAPGRGGGTNAVVARHPAFRVDYHGASIRDHRRIAREGGLDVATVDSVRLATDVDEPADLVEVVLHGDGAAAAWLADAGFEVRTTDGRVVARRPE